MIKVVVIGAAIGAVLVAAVWVAYNLGQENAASSDAPSITTRPNSVPTRAPTLSTAPSAATIAPVHTHEDAERHLNAMAADARVWTGPDGVLVVGAQLPTEICRDLADARGTDGWSSVLDGWVVSLTPPGSSQRGQLAMRDMLPGWCRDHLNL
jgi:hypothetical protein